MKKKNLKSLLLSLVLLATMIPPHIHDDKCGYHPDTKTGCVYEIEIIDIKDPTN